MLGEHALPVPAGADQSDLDAEPVLDEPDVPARSLGKLVGLGDVVEGFGPARQGLVDRVAMVEVGLVGRELLGLGAVAEPVSDADRQLREGREDV